MRRWGRLLYFLLVTPAVLVAAVVAALFAPASLSISYMSGLQLGETATHVSIFCLAHRSRSGFDVDRVTVLCGTTWTRIYPPDLACVDTEGGGGPDLAPLGPLTPALLADRLRAPGIPDAAALAATLEPWIREIARAGPEAMESPPFPVLDYDAPIDPDLWYCSGNSPGTQVYPRLWLGVWILVLGAAGVLLEVLAFTGMERVCCWRGSGHGPLTRSAVVQKTTS